MTGELISRETAIQTVHDTMYQFIDDSEIMTDRDGLLLKANKAICNGLKEIPSVENKGDLIRQAEDYENEIADLHNRLDIAEYDKERYKEEITTLEVKNKGEWIKIQSGDKDFPESIVCSKCKNENSHLDFNEYGEPIGKVFVTSKFCPNCGAKMKGGEE